MNDPYSYYGMLREEDPIHWNELYELWVITRHADLVWLTRNHELFSSATFLNDTRSAYPAIFESDDESYHIITTIRENSVCVGEVYQLWRDFDKWWKQVVR